MFVLAGVVAVAVVLLADALFPSSSAAATQKPTTTPSAAGTSSPAPLPSSSPAAVALVAQEPIAAPALAASPTSAQLPEVAWSTLLDRSLVPVGAPGSRPALPLPWAADPSWLPYGEPPMTHRRANILGGWGVLATPGRGGLVGAIVEARELLGGSAGGDGSVYLGPPTTARPTQGQWEDWQRRRGQQ